MRSFFRFVLLALVLLVVALVSALTAMRFAIHGREVAVPNLVGRAPADARRLAEEAGFEMAVERQYYSPSVPEGKILSQLPTAGTLVRRGWEIRVAASLGPQRVPVPNVMGQSERAAAMNIGRRGLDVGMVATMPSSGVAPDEVLSQSPPPNAGGLSSPKISLLVAQPVPVHAFVMPSFIGQPLSSVKLILQNAGLRVGTVSETPTPNSPVSTAAGAAPVSGTSSALAPSPSTLPPPASVTLPTGIITSQNPAPGEKVSVGAAVNFVVR
jgi:beta-lactam-binding protein with PASTA domain